MWWPMWPTVVATVIVATIVIDAGESGGQHLQVAM